MRDREKGRKNNRGMAVTVLLEGRIKDMHAPKKRKPELMSGWTAETSHIPQLWIISSQAHKEWLVACKWLVLLQQI